MTIFLPARLRPTGGSSSFARKFAAGLASRGHTVVFEQPKKYDILLANAACPPQHLLRAKANRKPIIHRLDGVYYPMTAVGKRWRYHNVPLWLARRAADHIIYQSQYSRRSAERFLGRSRAPHTVIYNGVDTNRFTPAGPAKSLRDNDAQHLFITASRFRRPDQIDPVIELFEHYRRAYEKNSKLIIVGNFEGAVADRPKRYRAPGHLEFLDIIQNENLPAYLRAADAFLFTHLNPPCPNNVIEALACGLPVCGIADGAMPELVETGKSGELAAAGSDGFFTPRQLATIELARNLHKIMQNSPAYSHAAREATLARFSLDKMVNQYLTVIQHTV